VSSFRFSAGGGLYWWLHLPAQLPPGIAFGNGRIEAKESTVKNSQVVDLESGNGVLG
jgi:hypothetical protein